MPMNVNKPLNSVLTTQLSLQNFPAGKCWFLADQQRTSTQTGCRSPRFRSRDDDMYVLMIFSNQPANSARPRGRSSASSAYCATGSNIACLDCFADQLQSWNYIAVSLTQSHGLLRMLFLRFQGRICCKLQLD